MTTANPAQPRRDVDLDAVRSAADSDAARKAVNLIMLTLWKYRIEHAGIVNAAGTPCVEVRGEPLADTGWSHISFRDLHLRLSYMGAARPKWLLMLMKSPLPWRWLDFIERRVWLRPQAAGRIEMEINNVPVDVAFRASDGGRINLEISEVPPRPARAASAVPNSLRGWRAVGIMVYALRARHIRRVTIVKVPDSVQVKAGDELLPDEGWSIAPFEDVHRQLSLMTGVEPPRWLTAVRRSALRHQWRVSFEYRFWRPRLPDGRIHLGDMAADLQFRAVDDSRIELELTDAPQSSSSSEGAANNN